MKALLIGLLTRALRWLDPPKPSSEPKEWEGGPLPPVISAKGQEMIRKEFPTIPEKRDVPLRGSMADRRARRKL